MSNYFRKLLFRFNRILFELLVPYAQRDPDNDYDLMLKSQELNCQVIQEGYYFYCQVYQCAIGCPLIILFVPKLSTGIILLV